MTSLYKPITRILEFYYMSNEIFNIILRFFLPMLRHDLEMACKQFRGNLFRIDGEIDDKHALQIYQIHVVAQGTVSLADESRTGSVISHPGFHLQLIDLQFQAKQERYLNFVFMFGQRRSRWADNNIILMDVGPETATKLNQHQDHPG